MELTDPRNISEIHKEYIYDDAGNFSSVENIKKQKHMYMCNIQKVSTYYFVM
jgi:hypothetical protein